MKLQKQLSKESTNFSTNSVRVIDIHEQQKQKIALNLNLTPYFYRN